MTVSIVTESDLLSTISSSHFVLIDVFAMWCEPCQRFLKIMPRLEEMIGDRVSIGKVDVDRMTGIRHLYNIQSVPTFLFFKDGQEVRRFSGIKTLREIEEIVNSYL